MHEAPTPEPVPTPPSEPTATYRDRRMALIVFGIVQLFLAALCLLMTGLVVLGHLMSAQSAAASPEIRILIPAVALYAGAAFGFACLGIGSIQCRRWARALTLVLAWFWLVMGVVMVPMVAWVMPKVLASIPGQQPLPQGAIVGIIIVQVGILGLFFILLPAGFVFFYSSRHVKATCEARDPVLRWTDACPLPVLGVACALWGGAVLTLPTAMLKLAVIPFFGQLIAGWPGAALMIGLAALFFWVGRAWYRLNAAGWWTLLAVILFFGLSGVITFSRVELVELYRAMNYPQAQIDLIQRQGWMNQTFVLWCSLVWLPPILAYLVWVKRYFRPPV